MSDKLHREAGAPKYRTSPDQNETGWPKGVKYIIWNEGCERFSFYGMKAILLVYLVFLYQQTGLADGKSIATAHVHFFIAGTYALSIIGALLAEKLLGKYRTIFWLSIVYCLGHAALSMFEGNRQGIYLGLILIAVGAGGIKPCVSANVGDQFGRGNWHRVQKVYQAFYFIINFGSFFSTWLIPAIKEKWGFSVAFAIPGILMAIATIWFWAGRHHFVHVPPKPGGRLGFFDFLIGTVLSMILLLPMFGHEFGMDWTWIGISMVVSLVLGLALFSVRQRTAEDRGFLAVMLTSLTGMFNGSNRDGETTPGVDGGKWARHWFFGTVARRWGEDAAEGPAAVIRIITVFLMVSVFWALFDQHASSWILQAAMMDREINLFGLTRFEILPEQFSAANPVMVMVLIPFVSFVVYPGIEKLGFKMSPLRRMTLGMFLAALAFATVALVQTPLDAGKTLSIGWQLVPYLIITLAEVMVSITGLEFAYTQAPRSMKSTIMSIWLLCVAFGNILAAFVFKAFKDYSLTYIFWIFTGLMAGAALLFGLRAAFYQYREYPQE